MDTDEEWSGSMRARVEKVSPKLARKWLENSEGIRQRGVRKNRVEKLAHAIQSGQWQITHQGIALSPDGEVLDGQHRLHAIILADEAVSIMVMRDVPTDVFHSIDTGASRTPSDSLKIAGYQDVNVLAAVVRTMIIYDKVVGTNGHDWQTLDRQVTTTDILEWVEVPEQKEAAYSSIKAGRSVANAVARFGATTPLSSANCILRIHPSDIGLDTVAEFNARLMDGVMLPARSPILALRRWLVSDTGYMNLNHSVRRPVTISIFLKAMNDYALGLERSLSIFRYGTEPIPAPLQPGQRAKLKKEQEKATEMEEAMG